MGGAGDRRPMSSSYVVRLEVRAQFELSSFTHPWVRNRSIDRSEDPLGIKRLPLHRVRRSLPSSNPINIRLVTMLSTVRRLSARRPSRRPEMALESPLTARRPSMPQISLSQTALARTAAVSSKKGRTSQVVRAETTDLAKVRDLASILIYTQRPRWYWAFPGASAAARPCTRGSVFRWEIEGKGAVGGRRRRRGGGSHRRYDSGW